MSRIKNQLIIAAAALVVLAAAVVSCAPAPSAENGVLQICAGDAQLAQVSIDEMRSMRTVTRRMEVHSSRGSEVFDFRGTLLKNVLNAADPAIVRNYSQINVVGADGYAAELAMPEVLKENNVYVMFENGDEPLPKSDGTPGGMRIVVIADSFGQRFTNYLIRLELR